MKQETLSVLICPVCRSRLAVTIRKAGNADGRLRDGILQCVGCKSNFPVVNWIPRLLPHDNLTENERSVLKDISRNGNIEPCLVDEERLSPADLRKLLKDRIQNKLNPSHFPTKLRERGERDVAYRLDHSEEKGKFCRTAQAFLDSRIHRIIEIGGGQGGALTAFRQHFKPEMAILLDIDPEWVEIAWLRDPDTDVIRADATRIPLENDCMDFLFSSATLEHIEDWKEAIHEMVRIGRQGLLCYNPNAGFPYDIGHLDAPLVTWLPKETAVRVAYLFHRLRRTGRESDSLREELKFTFYIHRRAVVRELERFGAEVDNAFGEFMTQTVSESYHIRGGRLIVFLKKHPMLLSALTRTLVSIGAEPNAYLFFKKAQS